MKKFTLGFVAGLITFSIPLALAAPPGVFKDVIQGSWYENAVQNLQQIGVIHGYSDGTFCPNQNISRAEVAVMLDSLKQYVDTKDKPATTTTPTPKWLTYEASLDKEFSGIRYPANFYATEEIHEGKILSLQSASGKILLPGEGTECAYDKCNIVSGGLRILISAIDPAHLSETMADRTNLEKTQYSDVEKVKDVSKVDFSMYDPTNLKEMYYFKRPQNIYRVEVYENNFSGNSREIIDEVLKSFSSLSEKKVGYVKKVYTVAGKEYIDVDTAEIFFREEADKAAQEDKECAQVSENECIALNSIYIRNKTTETVPLLISPNVKVKMATYDMTKATNNLKDQQEIDYKKFQAIFVGDKAHEYLKEAPFYFEVKNGEVIKITEQFLP